MNTTVDRKKYFDSSERKRFIEAICEHIVIPPGSFRTIGIKLTIKKILSILRNSSNPTAKNLEQDFSNLKKKLQNHILLFVKFKLMARDLKEEQAQWLAQLKNEL